MRRTKKKIHNAAMIVVAPQRGTDTETEPKELWLDLSVH